MPSILFVTQVDLSQDSGNARHVLALADALADQGLDLTLLAPGHVSSKRYHHVAPLELRAGARLEAVEAAFTARLVRKTRPDLAYVRLAPSSLIVPQVLATLGVPYFLELNGPILDQISSAGRPRWITSAISSALRFAVSRSRGLIVPSPILARYSWEKLGARSVHLIENGVDLSVASPLDRVDSRRSLGFPLDRPLITLVGTLTPVLRLDLLFSAFSSMSDAVLVICGDGAQRSLVESSRSERMIWLGARPHAQAIAAIAAADVCVNVHDSDLSLKSLEYAAVGRRQVAFEVEGIDRIVSLYRDLEGVITVRDRTPAALRAALEHALRVERERGPLPPERVEAARKELGWDHKARRLAELFKTNANAINDPD